MHRSQLVGIVLTIASNLAVNAAAGQTARVLQNANLRPDPSTAQPPLRLLAPPEIVKVPGVEFQNGYYRVETSAGESGWAWAQTLELSDARGAAPAPGVTIRALGGSNVRSDPSSDHPPLTAIRTGAKLLLLSPEPQNGYFHVRLSDGRDGWVWTENVDAGAAVGAGIVGPSATPTLQPTQGTPGPSPTRPAPPWFQGVNRPLSGAAAASATPTTQPTTTPTRGKKRPVAKATVPLD